MSKRGWVYENNWPYRLLWPVNRKLPDPDFAASMPCGEVSYTMPYGTTGCIEIKYRFVGGYLHSPD